MLGSDPLPPSALDLSRQAFNADFSRFPVTKPISVGPTLPKECKVGQLFFLLPSPDKVYLYGCTAPNVWTAELQSLPLK
jgi:hypothetical protein